MANGQGLRSVASALLLGNAVGRTRNTAPGYLKEVLERKVTIIGSAILTRIALKGIVLSLTASQPYFIVKLRKGETTVITAGMFILGGDFIFPNGEVKGISDGGIIGISGIAGTSIGIYGFGISPVEHFFLPKGPSVSLRKTARKIIPLGCMAISKAAL